MKIFMHKFIIPTFIAEVLRNPNKINYKALEKDTHISCIICLGGVCDICHGSEKELLPKKYSLCT
jgi:hypothetical protein